MASDQHTESPANAPIKRVRLFDTLRGFSVISMVLFHFVYDLVFIQAIIPSRLFFTVPVDIWRASISWTFLIIAGAMCVFSRNNYKRAAVYLAVALAVYLATSLIDKSVEISFGIIYCMGFCTLFCAIASSLGFKPEGYGWAVAFFILFLLAYEIPHGRISFMGVQLLQLPRQPFFSGAFSWLGMPGPDFMSADYYPPLPYLFLYLTGWSLGLTLKRAGFKSDLWQFSVPALETVGRYALPIYVIHQPVLLALSYVVAIAVGG